MGIGWCPVGNTLKSEGLSEARSWLSAGRLLVPGITDATDIVGTRWEPLFSCLRLPLAEAAQGDTPSLAPAPRSLLPSGDWWAYSDWTGRLGEAGSPAQLTKETCLCKGGGDQVLQ